MSALGQLPQGSSSPQIPTALSCEVSMLQSRAKESDVASRKALIREVLLDIKHTSECNYT